MSSATENCEEAQKEEEPFGLGCALESFSEYGEVLEMIDNLPSMNPSLQSQSEKAYERFQFILGQYQEQPHLLDAHIDAILNRFISLVRDPKIDLQVKHSAFKYMGVLIKVRGYKVIVPNLPHEVSDFEPVLSFLEQQDEEDPDTWTTRYTLLLWLSIIVMIPFQLSRLDGFSDNDSDGKKTILSRVLDICMKYVIVSDKCRDAAAYLTARFITRYDVKDKHMPQFFEWACSLSIASDSVFVKYGCLAAVASILKYGKRDDVLPHARKLLEWIVNSEFKNNPGTMVQKLVYKNVQRIGLTFLPARIFSWRYQRGNRSLATNLSAGDSTVSKNNLNQDSEIAEEEIDVPDEVEEVIDQLIQGLRSGDSVVRWSAAKGIGRVTGRLPKELADEVVGSVLELFNPREGDGAWHGGCLALAELGRRGLLLPERLPVVVPVILKALVYDEPRGYSSVGSHIRDSACYVSWAFARAYETNVLRPFVNDIASNLLIVACFDREINCRRAASAAFQENVGRQGTFPYGIEILTTADFFAVSVRKNSYLHISVFIAQFEEYTLPLITHLVERKIDHWDIAVRELAAQALHNLTPMAPTFMVDSILPILFEKSSSIDLNSRHGSILAIGEIIHALSLISKEKSMKIQDYIPETILRLTRELVPLYSKRLYFRGMGGELMKQACSHLIQKCSLSHLPFHNSPVISEWLQLLDDCLAYDVVNIRSSAINALPAFLGEYYMEQKQQQIAIVEKYVGELLSSNQVKRMGHALALGALPKFMLTSHLDFIIGSLIKASKITPDTLKWAESRRDVTKALANICETMKTSIGKELTQDHILLIYDGFLNGLLEYTQDNRGDIGAWVREASMCGLHTLTTLVAEYNSAILNRELVTKILTGTAQQAVEKIDRTRALAGKIFYGLIYGNIPVGSIPNHEEIKLIFPKEECDIVNWFSATVTFEKFVQLLRFTDYTYPVLLGLVCSIGGLTETLVKWSSAAFFEYLRSEEKKCKEEVIRLSEVILKIFADNQKIDRITVPMFRFLDKLLGSNCLQIVIHDPQSEFPRKIFRLIQVEIAGCRDIYKLIDAIDVLCQLLQIKSSVASDALVQLSILLCHRQSYVRRSTSTRLYEALLIYGDNSVIPIENLDEIMKVMGQTNWEDTVDIVKPIRNTLCALMGVRVPVTKKKD